MNRQNGTNKITDKLRRELSEGRFLHSIGVAECARELALRFGCDVYKAYIAGLLHDCATKYTADEMQALAITAGLCTAGTKVSDPIAEYHAALGAYVAKNEYGIDDPEILQAIAYHQVGQVPMTRLDMIISLADGIEPSRNGEKINMIRQTAKSDLILAYTEKCALYITNILNAKKAVAPERIAVYNYLITLI